MNVQQVAQTFAQNPDAVRQTQETMQGVLSRSATDMAFRAQLLSDPRSAIASYTGREAGEGFNVKFIENKAAATIVLPNAVDANAELSEGELEAVAGGIVPLLAAGIAVGVFTIVAEAACIIAAAVNSD